MSTYYNYYCLSFLEKTRFLISRGLGLETVVEYNILAKEHATID